MADQATKDDIKNIERQLDTRFDELAALMSGFANDVQTTLSGHTDEFRRLNKKYDHLIDTIDGFIGRIDSYETELAARDHKIERMERWIQELAAKANIQLT